MTNFKWNQEKIDILKEYYPTKQYDIIFKKIGTTNMDSIRHKAMECGITVDPPYTDDDIEFIKNNFLDMKYEDIANILGKTVSSLTTKINNLGLKKSIKWSKKEKELLIKNYYKYTNYYLSKNILIGRNKDSINTMARKLGLKKSKNKRNKFYDKDELLNALINLAEELGRTPMCDELSHHGLPSDTTYRRYFGGYKKACLLAGLEPNYVPHGNAKIYLSSMNDICYSWSEYIVTEFFIDNEIYYNKEVLYSQIIDSESCGNKRMDWL